MSLFRWWQQGYLYHMFAVCVGVVMVVVMASYRALGGKTPQPGWVTLASFGVGVAVFVALVRYSKA